jgi:hypothetical protein
MSHDINQDNGFADAAHALGFISLVGALAVWAAEVTRYLKYGSWEDWDLVSLALRYAHLSLDSWIITPNDWTGLHKILSVIIFDRDVGLVMFGFGLLLIEISWVRRTTSAR